MSQQDLPNPDHHEPLARPARRRWVSAVLGLVIFASGFLAGGAATAVALRNIVIQRIHHPELGPPAAASFLRRKLDLSDGQTTEIEAILKQRQTALAAIRRRAQPAAEAELDLLESQVSAVLNPDQRREWHEWFRQMRHTWIPPLPPKSPDDDSARVPSNSPSGSREATEK